MFAQRLAAGNLDVFETTEGWWRMNGVHHTAIVTTDVERALRFWQDGLGLTRLFDHVFTGDWPTLFDAKTDTPAVGLSRRPRALRTPASSNWSCSTIRTPAREPAAGPAAGFFLVSLNRDVEPTLRRLAELGIHRRGRGRSSCPRPGGKQVEMAVVTAPDGVRVELIGPAR